MFTPDTHLKRRVSETLRYYQSLADVISRKAAEEERAASSGRLARLAGELKSAVKAMVGIAGKAGFGVKGPG